MNQKIFMNARWWIAILLFAGGCNLDRPCEESTRFPVKTGFYKYQDHILKDTLLQNLTIYALSRPDSFITEMDTLQAVDFPLSPFSDTTLILFRLDTVSDTLSFYYDRQLMLLSKACGFVMFFTLNDIQATHHFIDSLSLTDRSLDANKKEHLQIIIH